MVPNVSLEQLRRFVVVAEELHFTRAADRLHVAQQALSTQVRQLEQHLGVTLFDRSTRRVSLTPAGETVLEAARQVLATMEEAVALAQREERGVVGRLRVGFGINTEPVAHPVIRAFEAAHPEVEVVRHVGFDGDNLEAVRARGLDAAFSWEISGAWRDLDRVVLSREPVLAALPKDHPLAALEVVPRERFAREPLVMFRRDLSPGVWDSLIGQVHGLEGVVPQIADEVAGGHEWMLQSTAEGNGVTFLSASGVAPLRTDDVELRPLDPPVAVNLELAWADGPVKPAVELLVEHARRVMATGPAASSAPPAQGRPRAAAGARAASP